MSNSNWPPVEPSPVETTARLDVAIKSGYGGILPSGVVVDRREFPDAIPIPANKLLGTPEPKP